MTKKKAITVPVSQEEFEEFTLAAKTDGVSLAEWARQRLRGNLRPAPAVMDEAFRQLDVSDRNRDLSGKPVPPPAVPPPQKLVEIGVRQPTSHVCQHFAHMVRQDGGPPMVCTSSSQHGRPCYFSSSGAADCPLFAPRARGFSGV